MNIFDLSNKTALVTGASSGLGWRFCQALASAGAHVIAAARRTEKLDELVNSIKQSGGSAESLELDVRSFEQVKKQISSLNQPIDICINNAAIAKLTSVFDDDQNNFESVMQTNVMGLWYVTKVVATAMKNQKIEGSIINIGSVNGAAVPAANGAAYNASKAAIMHMTKGLAGDLSPHKIRINAISPGFFPTDMSKGALEKLGDKITSRIPLNFLPDLSDLDGTILYLASNKASRYVTGSCITVDGGISWGGLS